MVAHEPGSLLPKLREHFAEFLQRCSLERLGILYLPTCVGLGYGLAPGLFPGTASPPRQSDKPRPLTPSVTTGRSRNVRLVPIDYAFRPRLRGRLTLRGLALRRNPWAFGESVSHTLCRYSCQHSHSPYLQHASQHAFTGLGDAPLPPQESRIGNRGSPLASRPHTVRHSCRFGIRPAPPSPCGKRSPDTRYPIPGTRSFGVRLEPRYIFGAGRLV